MTTLDDIRERLAEIRPVGSARNIVEAGTVRQLDFQNGVVSVVLDLASLPPHAAKVIEADLRQAVGALAGVREVRVNPAGAAGADAELGPLPGVADIIAISSAKGGVGKSTVAANLALAMQRLGKRVGLLDSDVYGPSVPIMFGVNERPRMSDDKRIFPVMKYGLQLMSVGFFLDENTPVIWRGPMVMGLVRQFLKDVAWSDLDVLLVDMPPGTGDAQLTLVQQVPLAGGVVVTTPQDVATLDVERGIAMFQQVNTPVLGIIENMSVYQCPHCGCQEDVFGSGGAARLASQFGIPLLGQIPLVPDVRRAGDEGMPIVVETPDNPVSQLFVEMAQRILDTVESERSAAQPPTIIG